MYSLAQSVFLHKTLRMPAFEQEQSRLRLGDHICYVSSVSMFDHLNMLIAPLLVAKISAPFKQLEVKCSRHVLSALATASAVLFLTTSGCSTVKPVLSNSNRTSYMVALRYGVALDLQAIDFQTQQNIPRVQTSNKIYLMKANDSTKLFLGVGGNSLRVNTEFSKKDAMNDALRLLAAVSVLELVGKYCDVPYWRCVDGAPADQKVVDAYRRALEADPNATSRLKLFAFCHGENIDLQRSQLNNPEREIVNKLNSKYGTTNDIDLITQLWMNIPIAESAQRLKTYRQNMDRQIAEQTKSTATFQYSTNSAAATAAKSGTSVSAKLPPVQQKITRPEPEMLNGDFILKSLGDMLQAYNTPVVRVQVLTVNNATAGECIPNHYAQLITTMLGKIQGPVEPIPYAPAYVLTDNRSGKSSDQTIPDLLIKGAITEFDKDMFEKRFEAEGDFDLTAEVSCDHGPTGRAGLAGPEMNTGIYHADANTKNSVLHVTTKGSNRDLTIKATDGSKVDTGIEARGSKIEGSKIGVNTGVDIIQATRGSRINTSVEANNSTVNGNEINVSTKTAPRRDPLASNKSEINAGVIANNATIKGSKVNINTTTTDDIIAKDGSKINTGLIANGAKIEGSQLNANTVAGRIEATGGSEINTGISANNANIKGSKLNANTAVDQPKTEGGSENNTGIKVDGTHTKVEDMTINTGVISDGDPHNSNTKAPSPNESTAVDTTQATGKPEVKTGITDDLHEIDEALRSLGTGTLAFNTPDKMMLYETTLIHLVLGTAPRNRQLALMVCGPGPVVTAEARYAPLVEARLVSDAFEITPVTETRQPVSAVAPTEWRWQVSAKQLGTHNLYLSVYAVVTLKNERHERLLQTFERKLEVQVKFSNHPVTYLRNRPLLVLGGAAFGLLLAGGCLAYLRFARRIKASGGVWRVAECQQNTQVFVSYSRKDGAWALEFTEALRAKGFRVWMDVSGIAPATLWAEQIVKALTQAQMLVLVGSRHSFASRNVHKEVTLASEHQKTIVLLVIDDSDVPAALAFHLAGLQRIQTASAETAAEAVSKLPLLLEQQEITA